MIIFLLVLDDIFELKNNPESFFFQLKKKQTSNFSSFFKKLNKKLIFNEKLNENKNLDLIFIRILNSENKNLDSIFTLILNSEIDENTRELLNNIQEILLKSEMDEKTKLGVLLKILLINIGRNKILTEKPKELIKLLSNRVIDIYKINIQFFFKT